MLKLDEEDLPEADRAVELAALRQLATEENSRAVPFCATIELEIAQLDPADAPLINFRNAT